MSYTGLDHVGFAVSDLDRSVEWYTFFLGEPPILRKTWDVEYVGRIVGYPGVKMEGAFWRLPGGTVLELLEYLNPPPGRVDMETYNAGNGHLCLVVDDLDADFARLRGRVEFRDPDPVEIPWGPYKGGKACYLRDPDGISIELMQLPPGGPKLEE
ncbi:MAG TPA: VOC family protein [Gaiellaceae bacterium]|nr:VOC family protein [Gaiellaceae bacterium]